MASGSKKIRLDKLIHDLGLCDSRAQAQALIMAGKVRVNGETVTKPGSMFSEDRSAIELTEQLPYVSRGGLKLAKALQVFPISVSGRICIDVGASTGGFTDCLLQNGAGRVIAVDVGYGQLDWKLRSDDRVQVLEKTNIRALQPEQLSARPSLGVVDTSFISLKKVLPPLAGLLTPDAEIMALLKPQFEYKDYMNEAGFKGVVHGAERHERILAGVLSDLAGLLPDWQLCGLDFSPITGPKGNIEFLLYYCRGNFREGRHAILNLDVAIEDLITKSYDSQPRPDELSAGD